MLDFVAPAALPVSGDLRSRLHAALLEAKLTHVADALEHFSRSHDWFDLYKTLEVLEDDLGRRDVIWQSGWATRAEVTDLVLTANYYRHARAKRPPNMLTIEQARELMRRVLSDWLREKRSVQTL